MQREKVPGARCTPTGEQGRGAPPGLADFLGTGIRCAPSVFEPGHTTATGPTRSGRSSPRSSSAAGGLQCTAPRCTAEGLQRGCCRSPRCCSDGVPCTAGAVVNAVATRRALPPKCTPCSATNVLWSASRRLTLQKLHGCCARGVDDLEFFAGSASYAPRTNGAWRRRHRGTDCRALVGAERPSDG